MRWEAEGQRTGRRDAYLERLALWPEAWLEISSVVEFIVVVVVIV
jgi:hypothetical protein